MGKGQSAQKPFQNFLYGLLILLAGANLWLLGKQTGLLNLPRPLPPSPLSPKAWKEKLKEDPPLGIEVEMLKKFQGKRLLIVIDRCTDCVAPQVKAWSEVAKEMGLAPILLVTQDREERARGVLGRWEIEAKVLWDRKGALKKKLNAFFVPRAYLFEDGVLIWKQEEQRLWSHIHGGEGK